MKQTLITIGFLTLCFIAVSWKAFQFRHPSLNDSAFFTHLGDVLLWR